MKNNVFNQPHEWTNEEIEHLYDTNWSITLEQLSLITNKTIEELINLLLSDKKTLDKV